jgi:hypothetical protein
VGGADRKGRLSCSAIRPAFAALRLRTHPSPEPFVQPVHMRGLGDQKFEEVTPVMIRLGLVTENEISELLRELKRLTLDEQVLLAQARVPTASAVK